MINLSGLLKRKATLRSGFFCEVFSQSRPTSNFYPMADLRRLADGRIALQKLGNSVQRMDIR